MIHHLYSSPQSPNYLTSNIQHLYHYIYSTWIYGKTQDTPKDEFGVTHDNILYNKEEDKFYCLLDAPNKDSVVKHHGKHGFKPEWITEVKTTKAS